MHLRGAHLRRKIVDFPAVHVHAHEVEEEGGLTRIRFTGYHDDITLHDLHKVLDAAGLADVESIGPCLPPVHAFAVALDTSVTSAF